MIQTRLLTIEELRKYHTQFTTDFAFLLGAWQTEKSKMKYQISPPCFFDCERNFVDSPRFSSSLHENGLVCSFGGAEFKAFAHEKDMSCPLALEKGSVRAEDVLFLSSKKRLIDENESKELTFIFGAYPQMIATKEEAEKLEKKFQKGALTKTGNGYTFLSNDPQKKTSGGFQTKKCFEYELDHKRYVRIIPKGLHFLHQFFKLSNGEKIKEGKPEWVKVEPLIWKIPSLRKNQKEEFADHVAYLQVVPIAGMTWDKIDPFLKKRFSKEMMQSHEFCMQEYTKQKISRQKSAFAYQSRTKLKD